MSSNWTNERPTMTGLYWYCDDFDEVLLVRVVACGAGDLHASSLEGTVSFKFSDPECMDPEERWSLEPVAVPAPPYEERG